MAESSLEASHGGLLCWLFPRQTGTLLWLLPLLCCLGTAARRKPPGLVSKASSSAMHWKDSGGGRGQMQTLKGAELHEQVAQTFLLQ